MMRKTLTAFILLLLLYASASAQDIASLSVPAPSPEVSAEFRTNAAFVSALQVSSSYARRIALAASDPSAASEGSIYGNSVSHVPKYFNGSTWLTLQTTAVTPGGSSGDIQYNNAGAFDGLASVGVSKGGTGLTATPSNGQLPIGNGSGYTLATLTAGNGVSITNGAGSVVVTASGELLSTTSSVNCNTVVWTDFYTVPAGKTLAVTRIILRSPSVDLSGSGSSFYIRDSGSSTASVPQAITGLSGATRYLSLTDSLFAGGLRHYIGGQQAARALFAESRQRGDPDRGRVWLLVLRRL
jgi:hypothetical protein